MGPSESKRFPVAVQSGMKIFKKSAILGVFFLSKIPRLIMSKFDGFLFQMEEVQIQ